MNNIKIVVSTALVDTNNVPLSHRDQRNSLSIDNRYKEYDECLNIIKSFGYDFIIMETVKSQDDFLEGFGDVIYTNVNNINLKNRGSNYLVAMRKLLDTLKFNDNDMIIHITGRYPLLDNSFIEKCLLTDKDGLFGKDSYNQFYLFLYALKYDKLKNILNNLDINILEKTGENLEKLFSNYLLNDNIEFVERLGIIGRQSSSPDSIYGKKIY